MKHIPTLVVGLVSYLLFLLAALYGFSFTLGGLLPDPLSIPHAPLAPALLIDMGLVLIFGFQHSVMARSRWKQRWKTIVPATLERSLYVLIASCVLLVMFWCWQPTALIVWQINSPVARGVVYSVCLVGWGIVLMSTFQIDHFELFGLRQVWQSAHSQPQTTIGFKRPLLYQFVRHPMMFGFLLVFWAAPTMTVDRLALALAMTIYIVIGVSFEERALRRQFGAQYERYQSETPRLIPLPRKWPGAPWPKRPISATARQDDW